MKIRYLIAFALILIAWTFVCEWFHCKFDKKEIKSDTTLVEKWDTVHDTLPEIRYEKKIKYIPVPDSIFITDTITNEKVLPVVQRKYTDDSTYTAYVSGAKIDSFPRLDSILVRQKTIERTIINTIYKDKHGLRFKIRPAAGGGYDPIRRQWGMYVGGAVVIDW
jgi:hypothetical protein